MSNAALAWAFHLPLTGPRKAVLLALAEHADESGSCWPSVARLVLFSGVQERAVRNALRDLESANVIRTERSAGRTSNRYCLLLNSALHTGSNGHDPASNAEFEVPPTRHDMPTDPAPDAPLPGTSYRNPARHTVNPAPDAPEPLEPSRTLIEPEKKTRRRKEHPPDPEREAFWKLYPRKREGPAAFIPAWIRARKEASFEVIMDGLKRYPFSKDFLPMAETWLNQKRWLTEPDTLPLGGSPPKVQPSPSNPRGVPIIPVETW